MMVQPDVSPRVLVIVGQLEIGGTECHLAYVLPGMRAAGIDVRVFALNAGGSIELRLLSGGIPVEAPAARRIHPRGLLQSIVWLHRVLREVRPDVVHFFLPAAYLVGAGLTWGRGRLVMSRRGLARYHSRYPGVAWLERNLHRRMDAVLANSRAVARELLAEGVPRERLGLIYNGVTDRSCEHSRSAARATLGLPAETLVFVMVANLIPYKGHADLLQALALASPKLPDDWTLLLAGRDEGTGEALRAQAARIGIAANVRWLGVVEDIGPCLAAADIGILSSHEEGFSNSVLEGMAAGLPMVVTDVGGNAEAVLDGESGLVVPARAPSALAAALCRLAISPEARHRMGDAARRRANECFTVDACVAQYVALYHNLLAGVTPPIPRPAIIAGAL